MTIRMKRIQQKLTICMITTLVGFLVLSIYVPDIMKKFIGYQFFVVYTDSMEPVIPVNSLVLVNLLQDNEELSLKPQQIITFRAKRFEEDIILTHHFNKLEKLDNGVQLYRTNAEGTDHLDAYETTRKDIIGTYVLHIPYIGKIILFLKSKYGILLIAEYFIIYLINHEFQQDGKKWMQKKIYNKFMC